MAMNSPARLARRRPRRSSRTWAQLPPLCGARRRKSTPTPRPTTTARPAPESFAAARPPPTVDGVVFDRRARAREFSEVTGILPSGLVDQKQRGRYMRALQQLDNARITDPAIVDRDEHDRLAGRHPAHHLRQGSARNTDRIGLR